MNTVITKNALYFFTDAYLAKNKPRPEEYQPQPKEAPWHDEEPIEADWDEYYEDEIYMRVCGG